MKQFYFEFEVEKPALAKEGNPSPRYPAALRARNIEGQVLAQFLVDTLGRADMAYATVPQEQRRAVLSGRAWSRRTLQHLISIVFAASASVAHAQGHLPWSAGDKPPAFARVSLGQSQSALLTAFGAPDAVDTLALGTYSLSWMKRGVSATVTDAEGVAIINANKREAAALDGIRVGDPHEAVRAKWGEPTKEQGPSWLYIVGGWVVAVQFHAQSDAVERLSVGYVRGG
ncbi:MAG: energy transducer TonB [Gemmatimonadota bacterium]|nr:energy transducer TonB [Gemmatimonadota bacterium]